MISFRFVLAIIAALVLAAGFSAAAIAVTQGRVEQAIAFSWPALSIAVAIAVVLPPRRKAGGERQEA